MNLNSILHRYVRLICAPISLMLIVGSPFSSADYEYTHGKWVLNPAETVETRSKTYPLNEEGKAKLVGDVSNAITYWELDGANLTYTDNHGNVSTSPYVTRAVDAEKFEMVFVVDGNAIGGVIKIEPSQMGFCATFLLDHSDVAGQLRSHSDCYKSDDR